MWQRLSFYDLRVIGHYLGVLILVATFGLLAPFLVAVIFGEWSAAARYFFTIGVFLIAGSALRFLRIQPGRLSRQQAFAVTGLAWLVLALFGAIPLAASGHYANYLDSLFEAVSGFTTTGASIVRDLDHLSYADNMFRLNNQVDWTDRNISDESRYRFTHSQCKAVIRNDGKRFESIKKAAEALGYRDPRQVIAHLKGRRGPVRGYTFAYAEKEA